VLYCFDLLVHQKRISHYYKQAFSFLQKKKNHFFQFRLKVFFVSHFLKFSFHCQSTMNVDSQNVCMNGVKRWGGIFFVYN
jgi:hypothetical protein